MALGEPDSDTSADEYGPISRPRPKRNDAEHRLQRDCARYLKLALPSDVYFTGVDHAGARSTFAGTLMKARGIKPGQADLRLILPPTGRALEVEIKTPKGVQSDRQREAEEAVTAAGGLYRIVRSVPELDALLRSLGVPLRCNPL